MSNMTDSAVGAILEIPDSALQNIEKAEKAIKALGETSERVAKEVSGHWGTIAPDGLQKFIDKIAEAKAKMDGLGTINVTLNTQAAVQSTEQLSSATQKTSADVSKAVQDMAQSYDVLARVDISGVRKIAEDEVMSIEKIKAKIKELEAELKIANVVSSEGVLNPNIQKIADEKKAWEEYIRIITEASKIKEKALEAVAVKQDKAYLDEQKRLLSDILDLRKQVNAQKIVVAQGQVTGSSTLEQDKKILSDLIARLYEAKDKLKEYNAEKYKNVSSGGQAKAQVNTLNQENALIKEQMSFRDKLNAAIARGNELTAQTQANKARLGSSDEAVAQRQLNSDYKEMLKIIKEQGELKAKVASEGRQMNQDEINLIATLAQRYRTYYDDVKRVEGAYTNMAQASAQAFQNDKSAQLARNAVLLADAQNKATQSAEKHGLALRDTANIEQQIQNVNRQLASETLKLSEIATKAQEAKQALDEFNRVNPNNWGRTAITAEAELDKIKDKIYQLQYALVKAGDSDKPAYENQIRRLKAEYDELFAKIERYKTLMYESNVDLRTETSRDNINALTRELQRLEKELQNAKDANVSINKEIANGATVKSLASEYTKLTKRLQEVNDAMNRFQAAGGNVNSASFQALQNEWQNIMARRKEIEKLDIAEVNQYRQQMNQSAYQADLSAFIQNEAQKKAEAQKTVNEQVAQARQAGQQYAQSFAGAMAQYNNMMSGNASGKLALNLENIKQVLNDLKTAAGKLNLLDPAEQNKAKQLKSAIEELNRVIKQYKGVTEAPPTKTVISPQDAINMAKNASTLRELEAAYKALREAMANTKDSDPQWAAMNAQLQQTKTKIDEIKKKMGEFHEQSKQTSNVMGQLQSRIAAAFSVGAIMGFIKKMTEVRAQFELQRVALGAIIQDTDEANKIFLKIQQMALVSPFTIMQLERATKQIAAFGFETQKLVPTMKMFADISAGLGVEIDRLVLVMGHLKARNFLEGTMVRQFTNMGFNILGELSKYYSELEDKMISVAEVQDRVKKKMVSFEDVEEVLKRVTSQGGMFYEMQAKQAESLYGQLQRIKDATDLMLNDIGRANQSVIASVLTAIRAIISHWRDVWNFIKMAGSATAAYVLVTRTLRVMGVTTLKELGTWWKLLIADIRTATTGVKATTVATNALSAAMKGLMSSTGIGIIVAALATLAAHLWLTTSAAEALNEELGRISDSSVKNLNESIATFKILADTISDTSKTYNEREEAMKELNRVYSEILPKEKLEWDYIVGLNGDYKDLTKTITEYYAAKEYQQKTETILGGEDAKQLQKEVEEFYLKRNKEGLFGMMFPESVLKAKAEVVAKEISSGKIANSADAIGKRIAESLSLKNVDFSKWETETYGEIDLHDITQTAGRITDALGGITLASVMAENATMDLSEAFEFMDKNQLKESREDLENRKSEIESEIELKKRQLEGLSPLAGADAQREEYTQRLKELNTELEGTTHNLDLLAEAQAKLIAQDFKKDVEAELKTLTDVGRAYFNNTQAMKSLELQGQKNSKQYKELEEKNKKIAEGNEELKKQFGTELPLAQIATCDTTYDLEQVLGDVAKKAYPTVAKKAIEAMSQANLAILKGKKSILTFLQEVGAGLKKFLPDKVSDWIPDLSGIIGKTEKEIAALSGELKTTADNADEASNGIAKIYSDRAKHFAKTTGADIKKLDAVISKNMNAAETAKALRGEAKKLQADIDSYTQSSNKAVWSETWGKTAEQIEQMKKDVQGLNGLAKELDGVEKDSKKGAKGKDPELEMWKNRIKAIEEYYKAREKARKNLSESETKIQQFTSFEQLWKDLGFDEIKELSLDKLIAQGFDPKKLQTDLVSSLEKLKNLIPAKYGEVRKDLERTIAKEKIEIQFKVKEDERERLQQSINDMFDSYELTKELSKLGVSVDLTYMVGGKPTTLADIRKRYEELMGDFANKSEEEQKIIKKMGEDLTKKEYDNRKKQLQNYIKYLTESMGERAQIEIKAYQDLNKIREDETLDSFSKEQAIMQRRKKMQEDLIKFDFSQFKGSDVYLTVFKDLETASKEQLQFVINKLKEMQSTFKDLSPIQVKSIANEIKKMEDALAGKDSVKNLGKNLKESIRYARQHNDLLREQTKLQNQINSSEQTLTASQVELNNLQLKLKGIQDKNSDEWKEANDAVLRQQMYVAGLEAQIKALQAELEKVTGKINKGTNAWTGFRKGMQNVAQYIDATKQALDDVFEGISSAFNINDATRDTFDSISEIMNGLSKAANGLAEIDLARPFTIITGLGKAIGGVFSTIGGFFGIGDKKKEREIKKLTEKVETLNKAYQKLEKSIEKAYTFSDYKAGYSQMQKTLEAEKTAYEEMLALEKAKKKTDKEKVKEYEDALEDIAEKQKELQNNLIEDFGSTIDYRGAAEDFVSAWLDAFKEAGDGLDALNENWQEFIQNLFIKQAALAKAGDVYEKVIKIINDAMTKGKTDFDLKEAIAEAQAATEAGNEYMNEYLKALAEVFNIKPGGSGELILSDLQKGIQNITEPQAAAIEAYLNSMRFAVFRHTEQLDTLIATIQMQYGSGAENPVVTELKGIRGVLDNIYSTLRSVVKTSVGQTGIVIARS